MVAERRAAAPAGGAGRAGAPRRLARAVAARRASSAPAVRHVAARGRSGGALIGRLLLALAAVVVALVLVEGATRLVDRWHCLMSIEGDLWQRHPLYGWTH